MTKTTKIILTTCVLLVAGAGIAYAYSRRQKPGKKLFGNISVGGVIVAGNPDNILLEGSKDTKNIKRLQVALNILHKSADYINKNCGGIKWAVMPGSISGGNIVNENGTFDDRTTAASKFYLYREEVELEYLDLIYKKIDAWKKGDKCLYPLGIRV